MDFARHLNSISLIPWKYVFIATLLLMVLHTVFIQQDISLLPSASPTTESQPPPSSAPPNRFAPQAAKAAKAAAAAAAKPSAAPHSPAPAPDIHHDQQTLPIAALSDYLLPPDGAPEPYIAICLAIRDQARDLGEYFVHHYHHMGIRRFYIMDDGSSPPLSSFEYPGVPREVLTFVPQDQTQRVQYQQVAIYARCMQEFGKRHRWIAFLDGDEYLDTPGNETLREVLESFDVDDKVGALGVNWKMHTSSGLLHRPMSARKSFVNCIWDDEAHVGEHSANRHVKVIVRTDAGGGPLGPHEWAPAKGQTVGEKGDAFRGPFRRPITRDRIALHHYVARSREEFEEKMHRGNAMNDPKGEEFWDLLENKDEHVECGEMAKYDP